MDSLELFLIQNLTQTGLANILATFVPMIAPCNFLAKETFKYMFKESKFIKHSIKMFIKKLQLAQSGLSKNDWVSLYSYRLLKQTNIISYLASQIAYDLFVCKPMTNGELEELITGSKPNLKKII